jgi:ubiquinone/menaquinone biosynthesis C-methylase UbiE
MDAQAQIRLNVEVHDKIADTYESNHREIFNSHEQARLQSAIQGAIGFVSTRSAPLAALDVGCGSGNVTRHLLDSNVVVTAADVSHRFLEVCEAKFSHTGRITTVLLTGNGLQQFATGSYDVVTVYSVLHHVPDYLGLVEEIARVLKPGGVAYIDHESAERVHRPESDYLEFLRRANKSRSPIKRFLTRTRSRRAIVGLLREIVQPSFTGEGDIHVWPDDHIEFKLVQSTFEAQHCEILRDVEYLQFPDGMDETVFAQFETRCTDQRVLIVRKK